MFIEIFTDETKKVKLTEVDCDVLDHEVLCHLKDDCNLNVDERLLIGG